MAALQAYLLAHSSPILDGNWLGDTTPSKKPIQQGWKQTTLHSRRGHPRGAPMRSAAKPGAPRGYTKQNNLLLSTQSPKGGGYRGFEINKTILTAVLSLALLGGCSLSPTTLSCGVDGDESYVTMENLKDNAPQTLKTYAALCGFAYEVQNNETTKAL